MWEIFIKISSMELYSIILSIILGFLLLFAGQRLYWLFIGVVGFIFGFNFAESFFQNYSEIAVLVFGLISGLIGIFLAIFLQRIAIILAGILIFGSMAISLYLSFWQDSEFFLWLSFLAGGVIGGIIFAMFFDWALIIFSALFGAAMIARLIEVNVLINNIIFLILFVLGIIVQSKMLKKKEVLPES